MGSIGVNNNASIVNANGNVAIPPSRSSQQTVSYPQPQQQTRAPTPTAPATSPRKKEIFIEQYLGQKMSLLSTSQHRYHRDLYTVDRKEKAIALKDVSCNGIKYEFVVFRDAIIRKLWVNVDARLQAQSNTDKYIEGVFFGC